MPPEEFNPYEPPRALVADAREPSPHHLWCSRPSLRSFLLRSSAVICPSCGREVELSREIQILWSLASLALIFGGAIWSIAVLSAFPFLVGGGIATGGEVVIAARAPVEEVTAGMKRRRTLVILVAMALIVGTVVLVIGYASIRAHTAPGPN